MGLPNFQSFFFPFLKFSYQNEEISLEDVRGFLTEYFSLTEMDKSERVPSGVQTKFDNRIYWTKSYFSKAKLIKNTRRSHFKITDTGRVFFDNLQNTEITISDLRSISEFRNFNQTVTTETTDDNNIDSELHEKTPLESLEESYLIIKQELANELLDKIRNNSWQFFEDLVVDLMDKMGYGGSRNKVGEAIKRNNDEGIDGIINEDKLGLDMIYLQAKMWNENLVVGRPEVQKFVGALHGKRAKKGVFITTSSFARTAYDYVKNIEPKVVLIDGVNLTNLMIEHNVGVSTTDTFQIKKIDMDYFEL